MFWIHYPPRHAAPRAVVRRAAAAHAWQPSVDIVEQEADYLLSMDIPGVDPQTVAIETDKGVLSISGERRTACADAARYSLNERGQGRFQRQFRLPENADIDAIKADSEHGVLQVTIPKRSPRKITVTH